MIIKGGKVFQEDGSFLEQAIYINDHRLVDKAEYQDDGEVIDAEGLLVLPGLVDIHSHGAYGEDFSDGDPEGLKKILRYERQSGITSYCPTSMTLPKEQLKKIFKGIGEAEKSGDGATVAGINMEGPFISPVKKGAQDERNIIPCNVEICERFLKASDGLVKFIGIAPEESEEAIDFIKSVKGKVNVSLAHTNADYKTAKAAFEAGANHAVHLYNAMPPFSHRAPGVVGAVYDCKHVMPEIICDGIHIHPATVRATFEMMGADRMILISDSMRATGMPDGQYTLGGLDVKVVGKLATLVSDGAIAGSATNLMDCMRTVVKEMGLPLETAVACATMNPAKSLGVYDEYGSITEGKKANIVLLDKDLELQAVIKDGVRL